MSELGIHRYPAPCAHASATFGCPSCVHKMREDWAKETYDKWVKTYKSPKCGGCGGSTKAWEYHFDGDHLKASVGCVRFDAAEGSIPCAEHDFEVKIA